MNLSQFIDHVAKTTGTAPTKSGDKFSCRCPAHEDNNPSLSISEGKGGRVLINCHAGCTAEAVVTALRLTMEDLFPESAAQSGPARGRPRKEPNIIKAYPYRDKDGKLLFEVCRTEPKGFLQRRPDASGLGGWAWNSKGVRQVPYRLPELITAVKAGQTVFIAEGEKDVEVLVANGFAATCNAGGAGKWREEFGADFDGAKLIVVIADKDTPGRVHAVSVANKLKPLVRSIKVIELPDIEARPVKDAADFFAAGGTGECLRAIVAEAPEFVPKEELTPGKWFKQRYPKLVEKYGEPVHETIQSGRASVKNVSEIFMAATIGEDGSPEAPTIYLPAEGRFYSYNAKTGIFERQREEDIAGKISDLFLECVRECRESAEVSRLEFNFRDFSALVGIIRCAKSVLAVPDNYFSKDQTEFIPVTNGILQLNDRKLLQFSPSYRFRHKLSVAYQADAYPRNFMEKLLDSALNAADIGLIQRWAGLALVGVNKSHKILLLTGTAGGGKSTLVSVITGIIGENNVGLLRTDFLGDRFEIGRLMDKSLLYGPDVPEDFLSKRTASSLKSLTGGDLMTAEFKNSNESPQIKCQFNVIVTSNSRLTVYLEGDADAWRRRVVIVKYEQPKPKAPIPNFAEKILAGEGSGVLNWMLDGLDALRKADWQLHLNERQQARVDDLLLESDSHREFVKDVLVKDTAAPGMTKAEVYSGYLAYTEKRGWRAMSKNRFGALVPDVIAQDLGLSVRGDIRGSDGKQNDGWKNLRVKNNGEEINL